MNFGLPSSVADVCDWLLKISPSFENYLPFFRENSITGDVLLGLGNEDLRLIGIAPLFHRRRILEALEDLKSRQMREDLNSTRSDAEEPSLVYTAEKCQTELASLAHDMVYLDQSLQSSVFELISKYLKCLRSTFRLAERPGPSHAHQVNSGFDDLSRRRSASVTSGADHIQFVLSQIARSVYMIWSDSETAYSSLDQNRCGLISLAQLRMGLEQNGVSAELLNDHGLIQHFQVRFPNRLIKLQEFQELFPPPAGISPAASNFYPRAHSAYGGPSPGGFQSAFRAKTGGHNRHFSSPDVTSLYQRERAHSTHSQREGSISGFSAQSVPVERAGSVSGFSTHSTPVTPYQDALHRQAGARDQRAATNAFNHAKQAALYTNQDSHSVHSEPAGLLQRTSRFRKNDPLKNSSPFGSKSKKVFSFDEGGKAKAKLNFNFSKINQSSVFRSNSPRSNSDNLQALQTKKEEETESGVPNPLKTVVDMMKQLRKPPIELFGFFKGSGNAVTVTSLIQGMKQCGTAMSEQDARDVIAIGDKNKDKTLRLVEWEAFCATQLPSNYLAQFTQSQPRRMKKTLDMEENTQNMLVEITKTIMSSEPSLSALFKKMCVSGGRRMTQDDLIEALKEFGIQLGAHEAESLIRPFDKTNQGLSRAEFIRFVNCGKSLA